MSRAESLYEENQRGGPAIKAAAKAPNAAPTPAENDPTNGISRPPNQPAAPSTAPDASAKASRPPADEASFFAGIPGDDVAGIIIHEDCQINTLRMAS